MNKKIIRTLFIGALFFCHKGIASPVCSPDASIVDNMKVVRNVFVQSKNFEITQKIDGSNDRVTSIYSFEFVDLDLSDFLLKTDVANRDRLPFHGKAKNIYVGMDIPNEELDFLFFGSGLGLDERLMASFKVQESKEKCILATEYYNDEYRAQLTVDSPSSLRIEYYLKDGGLLDEYTASFFFY